METARYLSHGVDHGHEFVQLCHEHGLCGLVVLIDHASRLQGTVVDLYRKVLDEEMKRSLHGASRLANVDSDSIAPVWPCL